MDTGYLKNVSFFDSGQGGLTIWEDVCQHFPKLNSTYLGDNARAPYGNKSRETIIKYSSQAVYLLARRQASMVVVACGSASSVAVNALEQIFRIPILGIVDSLAEATADFCGKKNRTVAVLGTRFTVQSGTLKNKLNLLGFQNIWQQSCPLFVPLVEEGLSQGEVVSRVVDLYLRDMPQDVKCVLLACTHFPRLKREIASYLSVKTGRAVHANTVDGVRPLQSGGGDPIILLEASPKIIVKINDFLLENQNPADLLHGERRVLCSDDPEAFERVARVFCHQKMGDIEGIHAFL